MSSGQRWSSTPNASIACTASRSGDAFRGDVRQMGTGVAPHPTPGRTRRCRAGADSAQGSALLSCFVAGNCWRSSITTIVWIAAFTCCSRNWRREPECVQCQPRGWLNSWNPPCGRGALLWEGELSMDFRPLNDTERRQLINACAAMPRVIAPSSWTAATPASSAPPTKSPTKR